MVHPDSNRATVTEQSALQHIAVIVNPVSGVNKTALDTIRGYLDALPGLDYSWHETQAKGDAMRFAQDAVKQGVDAVLAYGGDGTQAEAAAGLQGSDVPLAILPGGTANVMAVELGIPAALDAALNLIFQQPHQVRVVDMGCIDNQPFLLRAGIGYEAESTATAPRSAKREGGRLAYFRHALSKLKQMRPARYVITVDGQPHVAYGITCLICNSASIGVPHLKLTGQTDVSDGLLDVIVVQGSVMSLLSLVVNTFRSLLPHRQDLSTIKHWQGHDITVTVRPHQLVAYDGELLKRAKRVTAQIQPAALRVIVPAQR